MRVCVYCSSSSKIDEAYFDATRRLARALVKEGIDVVFGGGSNGLMGCLADTVLAEGGSIQGIMPQFMNEVEWAHKGVQDFIFTSTMHERKAKFLEGVDALITLPGGSGTLEELLEVITLKRLGQFLKPIIILNTKNYYKPLMEMLDKSVEEHFMREEHKKIWTWVNEPEEVIPAIKMAPSWDANAIHFATHTKESVREQT